MTVSWRALAAGMALASVFGTLSLLNTGGYRYGASDQAFYIPAMLRHVDPSLFPRDRVLLDVEARFMVFDELMGTVARYAPVSVPHLLFIAYLAMLAALAGSIWVFGRAMCLGPWTAIALVLAMAMRHRIAKTGVNTLEANFHPRMLAFAVGVTALAACLHRRPFAAVLLSISAAVLHPTTGLWFICATGVAVLVNERRLRVAMAVLAAAALVSAASLVTDGPLAGRWVVMGPEWLEAVAQKDYLFPSEWSLDIWATNLLYPLLIAALFVVRWKSGRAAVTELGLVAGMGALFLLFLISLPFTQARIALAVQLQIPRALWLLDFYATALLVWLVVEGSWKQQAVATRRWAVALVGLLALSRGAYVAFVERAGYPLFLIDLRDDDWGRTMRWLETTPVDTHVLADPGHLWRYGTSVRMAARRDVYLEDVKDSALAMYSAAIATRVVARLRQTNDYPSMSVERARALARAENLDYMVTEATLDLPLAYRAGRLHVYDLRE